MIKYILLCAVMVASVSFLSGVDAQMDKNDQKVSDEIYCEGVFANETYCHDKI